MVYSTGVFYKRHLNTATKDIEIKVDVPTKTKKKKRTKKILTKEEKKTRRGVRNTQLKKQYEFIKREQNADPPRYPPGEKIIRGKGDYVTDLGGKAGAAIGSWLGGKASSWMKKIFGTGDYMVAPPEAPISGNTLLAGHNAPKMISSDNDSTDFFGYDFIMDLGHTTDFTVTPLQLDITDAQTFPWLHTASSMYQQWQLLGMIIVIKSQSGEVVMAPASLGTIGVTISYDLDEPAPLTKRDALLRGLATSEKISKDQCAAVECKGSETVYPTMSIGMPGQARSNKQQYSRGVAYVWTEGAADDYEKAVEIYACYHVRCLKHRIEPSGGPTFMVDLLGTDTAHPLKPIDDTPAVKQPRINSMGLIFDSTASKLVFPLNIPLFATYLVVYSNNGITTTNMQVTTCNSSGGLIGGAWLGDQTAGSAIVPTVGTNTGCAASVNLVVFWYDGTGTAVDPPTLTFAASGTIPTSGIGATLLIVQISEDVVSGITAKESPNYTRSEFHQFLLSRIAHGRPVCVPPVGLGRLVEFVEVFKKRDKWPRRKPLPKASTPFDISYQDALIAMSRFMYPQPIAFSENLCEVCGQDVDVCTCGFQEFVETSKEKDEKKTVIIKTNRG